MNWLESRIFIKTLNEKEQKRYQELVEQYLNIPVDGHEAHIDACNTIEKERLMGTEEDPYEKAGVYDHLGNLIKEQIDKEIVEAVIEEAKDEKTKDR